MEIEVVRPLVYCPNYLLGLLRYCDKGLRWRGTCVLDYLYIFINIFILYLLNGIIEYSIIPYVMNNSYTHHLTILNRNL